MQQTIVQSNVHDILGIFASYTPTEDEASYAAFLEEQATYSTPPEPPNIIDLEIENCQSISGIVCGMEYNSIINLVMAGTTFSCRIDSTIDADRAAWLKRRTMIEKRLTKLCRTYEKDAKAIAKSKKAWAKPTGPATKAEVVMVEFDSMGNRHIVDLPPLETDKGTELPPVGATVCPECGNELTDKSTLGCPHTVNPWGTEDSGTAADIQKAEIQYYLAGSEGLDINEYDILADNLQWFREDDGRQYTTTAERIYARCVIAYELEPILEMVPHIVTERTEENDFYLLSFPDGSAIKVEGKHHFSVILTPATTKKPGFIAMPFDPIHTKELEDHGWTHYVGKTWMHGEPCKLDLDYWKGLSAMPPDSIGETICHSKTDRGHEIPPDAIGGNECNVPLEYKDQTVEEIAAYLREIGWIASDGEKENNTGFWYIDKSSAGEINPEGSRYLALLFDKRSKSVTLTKGFTDIFALSFSDFDSSYRIALELHSKTMAYISTVTGQIIKEQEPVEIIPEKEQTCKENAPEIDDLSLCRGRKILHSDMANHQYMIITKVEPGSSPLQSFGGGIMSTGGGTIHYVTLDDDPADCRTGSVYEGVTSGLAAWPVYPVLMPENEIGDLERLADENERKSFIASERAQEEGKQIINRGQEILAAKKPAWAKAAIIAELHQDDSDPHTDYHGSKRLKSVIIGWSKHTKDLFPEMRKACQSCGMPELADMGPGMDKYTARVVACENYRCHGSYYYKGSSSHANGESTIFNTLAEAEAYVAGQSVPLPLNVDDGETVNFEWQIDKESIEHREKYSMGHGYFLARDWRYSGWQVSKNSYMKDESLAAIAGQPGGYMVPDEPPKGPRGKSMSHEQKTVGRDTCLKINGLPVTIGFCGEKRINGLFCMEYLARFADGTPADRFSLFTSENFPQTYTPWTGDTLSADLKRFREEFCTLKNFEKNYTGEDGCISEQGLPTPTSQGKENAGTFTKPTDKENLTVVEPVPAPANTAENITENITKPVPVIVSQHQMMSKNDKLIELTKTQLADSERYLAGISKPGMASREHIAVTQARVDELKNKLSPATSPEPDRGLDLPPAETKTAPALILDSCPETITSEECARGAGNDPFAWEEAPAATEQLTEHLQAVPMFPDGDQGPVKIDYHGRHC